MPLSSATSARDVTLTSGMSVHSIRFRFAVLAALAALAVAAFTFISFESLGISQESNAKLQTIAQIVRRHLEGDMMHDAIRGDLLGARLARLSNDTAGLAAAGKDIEEHAETFIKDVEANLAEPQMPAPLRSKLLEVKSGLDIYIAAGRSAMAALSGTGDNSKDLAIFDEKFRVLEEAQETLSDDLLKWADESKSESAMSVGGAKLHIGLVAAFALLFALALPFYAAAALFRPLQRLQQTMGDLAAGNTETAVPFTDRSNEMGDAARAVDVFRQSIARVREITDEQAAQQHKAQQDKKQTLEALARRFEERVQSMIHAVGSIAGELLQTARHEHGHPHDA